MRDCCKRDYSVNTQCTVLPFHRESAPCATLTSSAPRFLFSCPCHFLTCGSAVKVAQAGIQIPAQRLVQRLQSDPGSSLPGGTRPRQPSASSIGTTMGCCETLLGLLGLAPQIFQDTRASRAALQQKCLARPTRSSLLQTVACRGLATHTALDYQHYPMERMRMRMYRSWHRHGPEYCPVSAHPPPVLQSIAPLPT